MEELMKIQYNGTLGEIRSAHQLNPSEHLPLFFLSPAKFDSPFFDEDGGREGEKEGKGVQQFDWTWLASPSLLFSFNRPNQHA